PRAREWLARARELGPDEPEVLAFAASARLGELLDENGRVADDDPGLVDVRAWIERAATRVVGAPPYVLPLVRAELASAQRQYLAATKFYNRAMAIAPRRPEAHLGLAQLLLGRGLYEGANEALDAAFVAGVRDPRMHYLRGFALGGLGRLDDARRFYETYLIGRPHDSAARRALAGVLAGQALRDLYRSTPEELEHVAQRILEYDPDNPKIPVLQGMVARHRRDMQGALVLFEKARERLGDDPELQRLLTETLRDRGYELLLSGERRGVAMECFRRALDLAPGTGVTTTAMENIVREEWERTYQAARDALVARELDDAQRGLLECLELMPDDPQPRLQLGFVHYSRGEPAELEAALAEFRRYVAGQRSRGRDAAVGVLYEVQTLRRLERLDDALGVADEFLGEPTEAASEANLGRIREVRDAVAQRLRR
ncbi:MAG: tetratricopeptide repeat protein, partial [Planctomycetes bacterium]|nr:tetratricopeptide repeat protein [Planctomycetota bacterium]